MLKEVFKKNKVFFITFFSLFLYHHLFILDSVVQDVNAVAYEFHAVDYSLGFCTKILPGAIYHLLVGRYTKPAITVYARVISILLILLLSLLAQRVYTALSGPGNVPRPKKNNVIFFLLLCLAGPCTFYYVLQFEACLDAYWIILFLICVLFADNRTLRWGIPAIAFLMVLVHEGVILCYLPLISLLLLLKVAVSEENKEKRALFTVFVLTVIVSLGATGYFMLYNSSNLKVSDMEQLDAFLDSRYSSAHFYYEWYFFGVSVDGGLQADFFPASLYSASASPLIQLFYKALRQIYYTVTTTDYISPLPQILYSLPLFVLLVAFLLKCMKRDKNKLIRFLGLCFLLLPLLSIAAGIIFSNDVLRWVSHALICLFVGVLSFSCFAERDVFFEIETQLQKHYSIIVPYIIGFPVLMV